METPKLPEKQSALVAVPQPLEIVIAEDAGTPLAIVLPPFEEIDEIEELKELNFSLAEHAELSRPHFESSFGNAFDQLRRKEDRFGDSAIFASRLATLARFAGRNELEWEMLERAHALSDAPFHANRYGEGLLAKGKTKEAEAFFESLDLDLDVSANLRLAYFCVQRRDFERADKFVATALSIDPLDYSARLFEGGLQLVQRNYQRAVQSFRVALGERPGSAVAYCNIAAAYVGMRKNLKALTSLKKAVALDPLNSNALCFLSDISFNLGRDEEALPSLRYFVQLEQKNVAIWSRLARASYRLGKAEEATEALRRQASLESSGAVWNNLGVVYQMRGSNKKALECYFHGARIDEAKKTHSYFLASRNIVQLLSSEGGFQEVIEFVPSILAEDSEGIIARDGQLSDLISMYIHALHAQGQRSAAEALAHSYLAKDFIADALSVWLVGALVSQKALRGDFDNLTSLARGNDQKIKRVTFSDPTVLETYFNNIAFAFAEMGDVKAAEDYLSHIINSVHKMAYPTATFGLIQFRKGKIDRATALYEEAVHLSKTKRDKIRIRQKLNLELGRFFATVNEIKARRWLEKVVSEKNGESELVKQANLIVRGLRARNGKLSE